MAFPVLIVTDCHGPFMDAGTIQVIKAGVAEELFGVKIEDFSKEKFLDAGYSKTDYARLRQMVYGAWKRVGQMEPVYGMKEPLEEIQQECLVVAVTSSTGRMLKWVRRWFIEQGITISVLGTGKKRSKGEKIEPRIKMVVHLLFVPVGGMARIYIDDKRKTIEEVLEIFKELRQTYPSIPMPKFFLFSDSTEDDLPPEIEQVSSWQKIRDFVFESKFESNRVLEPVNVSS